MNWFNRIFNRGGIYLFHHIPKCGGTSLVAALPQWFTVIHDYRDFEGNISEPLKLETLSFEHCLCGHFDVDGIYLHQRYPELFGNRKHQIFTFVRDPLMLKISLHYYEKKHYVDNGRTLEESLLTRPNYMSERFPCTVDDYRKVIDRYFFVGIVEHAQESMDKLADLLAKPRLQLGVENQSERDSQFENLSPKLLEKFRKENALDYLLYDYCYKRNRSICQPI